MSTQYYFPPYNEAVEWKKFDVIFNGSYKYSVADQPVGGANGSPDLTVIYNVTHYKRSDDVTTVYFTQTGNVVNIQRGTIVKVAGLGNSSCNYTGMALGDGVSGSCSYINPGWPESLTVSAGTVRCDGTAWTSGFFFSPTYSSKLGAENQAIITQLGSNYTQRMSQGLHTFNQNLQLVFQNRSDREARAITNFVEDRGGVTATEIMIPNAMLNNQPNQQYILPSVESTPVAFNLNDLTVPAVRVFDIR